MLLDLHAIMLTLSFGTQLNLCTVFWVTYQVGHHIIHTTEYLP